MTEKSYKELMENVRELEKQARIVKREETVKEQSDEAASCVRALYSSFVEQGFTEEQAYDLVKLMIKTGGKI